MEPRRLFLDKLNEFRKDSVDEVVLQDVLLIKLFQNDHLVVELVFSLHALVNILELLPSQEGQFLVDLLDQLLEDGMGVVGPHKPHVLLKEVADLLVVLLVLELFEPLR